MKRRRWWVMVGAWTLSLAFAPSAQAGDGRIEINQAKALAGGVTSCDTPGFPVEICAPGSYVLTSDLDYDSAASSAIVSFVGDVSIDLNGSAVRGTNSCTLGASGWVTGCTQAPSSVAIFAPDRSTVENGRVLGAAGPAVSLGNAAVARNLIVSDSGTGVDMLSRANVSYVTVTSSGRGVRALDGAVTDVVVSNNRTIGLECLGCLVARVRAQSNGHIGIVGGVGSTISSFTAFANGQIGVLVNDGSVVDSGSIRDNGRASATSCGLQGFGGASFRGVNITATSGGNPATACGMANGGGNFCQGVACP